MTDLPKPPFTEREDAFLSLAERYQENLRHEQHAAAELRAEIVRLRGLITQMVDAYDFPVDGELYADDYLMGVLDLLRKEARRD